YGPAAVDRQHRAGDEARLRRQQERDRGGHLLRSADPAERMDRRHLPFGRRGALRPELGQVPLVPCGGDGAECGAVAPDPVPAVLHRQGPGQRLERRLRGGVRGRAGHRLPGLVGGDVDDRAGDAGGPEAAHRGGAADDRRSQIDLDRVEHRLRRVGVHRGVAEQRGVVDPAGQLAGPGRGLLGDRRGRGAAGDHGEPVALRMITGPVGAPGVQLDHHDPLPVAEQPLHDRPADPLPASGDDDTHGDRPLDQVQMAPTLADWTSLAYLASTPRGAGRSTGCQFSRRRCSSSGETSRSRVPLATSSVILSPFSTRAIGPPSVASGAMCPTHSPVVPPENRPSVISMTSLPSPAPLIAPVIASISRMPGPPFGPSYRITTTSPAVIVPSSSASIAARSPSNTRAVPVITVVSNPALFTTAPSGASEPDRMVIPPVGCIGSDSARTMVPSTSGGLMSARFSATVRPVTVRQSPCSRPASSSARITTGTPPTRSTSFITNRPNGLRSPKCGTFLLIRTK